MELPALVEQFSRGFGDRKDAFAFVGTAGEHQDGDIDRNAMAFLQPGKAGGAESRQDGADAHMIGEARFGDAVA